LLETGTSSVLINGVPGINFKCRRGVRQGDPLSPLLFVLGAELLQYVINDLKDRGLLKLPILVKLISHLFSMQMIRYWFLRLIRIG
jgi:hypothetical protein